ncbi:hypothetical protein TcCL_ESM01053, partial [Trypanosoma cruzi]
QAKHSVRLCGAQGQHSLYRRHRGNVQHSSIMKTSPSSSLRETTKDDNPHPSQKTQWPALETLWRAAAVAAPTHNNYSSLGTLISSMRIRVQEVSEVQQLPVPSGDSKKQRQQSY